ncbi:MAG: Protease PrsW [Bacteroidota bacterium]|nr:Protease PrsW [Bacteroidota bacterium]
MKIIISLLPVFIFLALLIYLDSFKLVRIGLILICIFWGIVSAAIAYFVNTAIINHVGITFSDYSKYAAPFVEEILKALLIIYLMSKNKVGFMIDAAILGFAIGSGFGFAENLFYLMNLTSENIFLWIVRGFGTGIMHCGTVCIVGIIAMHFTGKSERNRMVYYLPGLAAAVIIHGLYNGFFISPVLSTLGLIIVLPIVIIIIFQKNENALRKWLDVELDTEAKLMQSIKYGIFSTTSAGKYILSIRSRFPKEVVFDIMCFIRLFIELSIKAKGILMMKEYGFPVNKDEDIESKLSELKFLRKNIGKTGLLAISPILRMKPKDLWKLNMLQFK